jgi:hypothetical protein
MAASRRSAIIGSSQYRFRVVREKDDGFDEADEGW